MKLPFQLPASGRYLRAKLLILLRPVIWGPAVGIVLLGLFTWPYWSPLVGIKPSEENATVVQEEDTTSQLSSEEQAIGADIDTLSLLLKETDPNQDGSFAPGLGILAGEEPGEQQGLFDSVFNSESAKEEQSPTPPNSGAAKATTRTSAPKTSQDFNFLNPNPLTTQPSTGISTRSPFLPGMEGVNPLLAPRSGSRSGRGGATLTSPLQTAIEQSQMGRSQTGQLSPSGVQSAPGTGSLPVGSSQPPLFGVPSQSVVTPALSTNTSGQTSTLAPGFNQALPSNGASTIPGITPANSIAPPVTPQTLPTTPVTTTPLGQSNFQSAPGGSSGMGSSTFNNRPQQLAQPSPPPFSVPRSIGNGEINTFSNP
ncbi:MAG: hypothetical protein SFW36_09080 [Leptolyngbyaceae cyanobacterium bins.59]|nr:hypothetical protein [Leptolyngbyaceae cyanobacterium bins.59]